MLHAIFVGLSEYRAVIHLALHVLVPLAIAVTFASRSTAKKVFIWLMLTMLVDVDHLFATPIYAPNRCSILFHPLHQIWPIMLYGLMTLWPALVWMLNKQMKPFENVMGWVGLGLLLHMGLDWLDCVWMQGA